MSSLTYTKIPLFTIDSNRSTITNHIPINTVIPLFTINSNTELPLSDTTYKLMIEEYAWNLGTIPVKKRSYELCMIAVKSNGNTLKFVPLELRTQYMCDIAFKSCGSSLNYFPSKLFKNKINEIKCFIDNECYENRILYDLIEYNESNTSCYEEIIENISSNGSMIQFLPDILKTENICNKAINNVSQSLKYVPDNLKSNYMCCKSFLSDGNNYKYASKNFLKKIITKFSNDVKLY